MRRRVLVGLVVAWSLLTAGCTLGSHAHPARPTGVTPAGPARPVGPAPISHARYVRPLELAGGLVVSPDPGRAPVVSEAAAIAAFRATSVPHSLAVDVTVGSGAVSLGSAVVIEPGVSRTIGSAWVITYYSGPHSCPMATSPPSRPSSGFEPFAFIYTGTIGITYTPPAPCFNRGPAYASYADEAVSVPWKILIPGTREVTITAAVLPGTCSPLDASGGSDSAGRLYESVYEMIPFRPTPPRHCPAALSTETVAVTLNPDHLSPKHGPLGPAVGVVTNRTDGAFTYTD